MLEIYKHYNGDGDMFSRLATAEQKQLFENEEWTLIDNLLQNIKLTNSNLVSDEYRKSIDQELKTHCSTDAIEELKILAI